MSIDALDVVIRCEIETRKTSGGDGASRTSEVAEKTACVVRTSERASERFPRAVFVDARRKRRRRKLDGDERARRLAVRIRDGCVERTRRVAKALGMDVVGATRADVGAIRSNEVDDDGATGRTCAPVLFSRTSATKSVKASIDIADEAHAEAIRAIRALCGSRSLGRAYAVESANHESTTTHVLIGDDVENIEDAKFGVAVTTRHSVRTMREYRPRWRRWLPSGARWAENAKREMSVSAKKTLEVDSVTVAEPIAEDDWTWHFLDTGSTADGLLRIACARADGREDLAAAAVEIVDSQRLERSVAFSYMELFDLAVHTATFMRDILGAEPGHVVGVLSRNSHEVFVLHHACAMARVKLLNLNTHLVARELSYIVRDAGCRFIFARASHADTIQEAMRSHERPDWNAVVWLDSDVNKYPRAVRNFDWELDVASHQSPTRALVVYNRELASVKDAHLYYTSGTTGNPKGVSLTHDIVRTHAHATSNEMRLNASDVWLHAAPMFHLVDAFAIYSITEVGGRHVFLPTFEASTLLRVIAFERITVSNLASSMVTILSHNPVAEVCDLSSLRVMSCGGSPLPPTVVARAISLFGCEFFVSYGMTECCGKISMSILTDEFRESSSPESQLDSICTSGRPFSLMSVKITSIDNPNEHVPFDGKTVGDVRVRGPTVFAGYLNDREATRRAFDDDGWFSTGDLGVMRPDGFIVIVDRKKDMILCGGENVYCVEVERVLHAHNLVQQAAVFGVPHPIMGESVHAAVTLRSISDMRDVKALESRIITHCTGFLSQYKCPTEVHIMEKFPMNASGKILKTNLRKIVTDEAYRRHAHDTSTLRRQFFPTVLSRASRCEVRSKDTSEDIRGVESYISVLKPVESRGDDRMTPYGSRWFVVGAMGGLRNSLQSLGVEVRAFDSASIAVTEDWFEHASRYRSLLREAKSGDTVLLAECLASVEDVSLDHVDRSVASATYLSCGLVISLMRAIDSLELTGVRVIVLTSNAFVASDESELEGIPNGRVINAPVIGICRVLRREHPSLDLFTIDIPRDNDMTPEMLKVVFSRMFENDGTLAEREMVINSSSISVPRLVRAKLPLSASNGGSVVIKGASCVIIGGLGALGLLHLKFLSDTYGIRRFILTGRTVRDETIENLRRTANEGSSTVVIDIAAADCCDADQARAVFALAEPVAITMHLAGVLSEGLAVDETRASFVVGTEAKIIGSLNMFRELSKRSSLIAVTSTSIFGLIGQSRLTAYAAANAFQDALCVVSDRSAENGPRRVIAIQWGTWDEDGMAMRSGSIFRTYWISLGMGFLAPRSALEFVSRVIDSSTVAPSIACFPPTDWTRFHDNTRAIGLLPALIEECLPPFEESSSESVSSDCRSDAPLLSLGNVSVVRSVVLDMLGEKHIDDDAPLMSVGLTSARAIQLAHKLATALGIDVPTTLAFDHPTLRLISKHFSSRSMETVPINEPVVNERKYERVFLVASAGCAPDSADHGIFPIGGDAVRSVPKTRWDTCDVNNQGALLCGFGAFVHNAAMFDSTLFNVSIAEACIIDPQQRLVLHSVASLPKFGSNVSVHVGVSQVEYPRMHFIARSEALSPYYATSAHLSVASGRIAYVFALTGCAESIDTACSSSLVAIARGYVSRESAVAGGVNLTLDVTWSLACNAANMLSADGRCKTLDCSADGYVRAEHASMMLIAVRVEADVIVAGVAVNQDGRSSTLTAPNGPSQTRAIITAYGNDCDVEVVSMHGTGTALGDPIEVSALRNAVRSEVVTRVLANKSLMGHAEPASGVSSLLLAADAIQLESSVAMTHVRSINPYLTSCDAELMLAIPRQRVAMSMERSASASAFAFMGTNAHCVVRLNVYPGKTVAVSSITPIHDQASRWCTRASHAWIKTGGIAPWGGRVMYTATIIGVPSSASLLDHAIHGEPIAPGTSLIELFLESFTQSVSDGGHHGRDIVVPHAMRLVSDQKQRAVFMNVITRRDGRVSVTSGPLCRAQTHLYGRVDRVRVVIRSLTNSASYVNVTGQRHLLARLTRPSDTMDEQSGSVNVNAYVLDAAIHLAEGVLQFDGGCAARVPAALDSVFCAHRRRGDAWREPRTISSTCSIAQNAHIVRGQRVCHDHIVPGTSLRRLDIRPPFGSRSRALFRTVAPNKNATKYAAARLTATPKYPRNIRMCVRSNVDDGYRTKDSVTRGMSAFTQYLSEDVVLRTTGACCNVFDLSSALLGASRCATHELFSKTSVACVDRHIACVDRASDSITNEDAFQAMSLAHGTQSSRTLVVDSYIESVRTLDRRRHSKVLSLCFADQASFNSLLVYGGTGALGARAAKDFAECYSSGHVALIGRSGRSALDINSYASIMRALRLDATALEDSVIAQTFTVQSNVAYASGVLADASWSNLTSRSLLATCAPKLNTARDWMDLSAPIGCRTYFSSATAFVGNTGQTVYGAANATLDRRAGAAATAGVNSVSIQWGAFAGGGMASGVEDRMMRTGIGLLPPDRGLTLLRTVFSRIILSAHQFCISAFDWQVYVSKHPVSSSSPFFANVIEQTRGHSKESTKSSFGDFSAPTRRASVLSKRVDVQRAINDALKSVLGREVTVESPFFELGMDSISSVEFVTSLETALDRRLPATLVFDYPSPKALAIFIDSLDTSAVSVLRTHEPSVESRAGKSMTDVIITASSDVPGCRALNRGIGAIPWRADDRVSTITRERWDVERYIQVPRFAGIYFGNDWHSFDGDAFGLKLNEIAVMDPQQRLTLRHAAEALRTRPCVDAQSLTCGVFIGAATNDYKSLVIDAGVFESPFVSTGCAFISVIAGRISYTLDLSGPSLSIDTACSSGLCATHFAHEDKSSTIRIIGSVNSLLDANSSFMFAQAGMLAADGRCKTLDASADGYARAEACAVVVIVRDSTMTNIGVVAVDGSAVNQDGRSSSLTAPNGPAQARVIRASAAKSGVSRTISSLHGTGTALGDPIEIGAMNDARDDDVPIVVLVATKTSCAHSESPAGLIGLIGAASVLSAKCAAHMLHLRRANTYLERALAEKSNIAARTSCAISDIRASGASAFAFQGTNACASTIISLIDGHRSAFYTCKRSVVRHAHHRTLPLVIAPACVRASTYLRSRETHEVQLTPGTSMFDHRVRDRPVLPGAAYLCITAQCAGLLTYMSVCRFTVDCVAFCAPLALTTDENTSLSIAFRLGRAEFTSLSARAVMFAKAQISKMRCITTSPSLKWKYPDISEAHVVVVGIISPSSNFLEESKAWAELDSSFHFLSATWEREANLLRIPSSVDAFVHMSRIESRGVALVPSVVTSEHTSRGSSVRGLRTTAIRPPKSQTDALTGTYVLTAARRISSRPDAQFQYVDVRDERGIVAAMQTTTPFDSALLTPRCHSFGIVASMRSAAMETRTASEVRVSTAYARCIARTSHHHDSSRRDFASLVRSERDEYAQVCIIGGAGALGQAMTNYFSSSEYHRVAWTSTTGRARVILSLDCEKELHISLCSTIASEHIASTFIMRASGVLKDAVIANFTVRDARSVMAAKCAGRTMFDDGIIPTWRDRTFTSIAGMLGSLGQAAYAGANELMDYRCRNRMYYGLDAKSIQYGPWAGGGMGNDSVVRSRMRTLGVSYMNPTDALVATSALNRLDAPIVTCVAAINWKTYALSTHRVDDEMFNIITNRVKQSDRPATVNEVQLKPAHRREMNSLRLETLERVIECVEQATGLRSDSEMPFMESGVDSVSSMDLSSELSRTFSITLPATFLFDNPTPKAAAEFIVGAFRAKASDSQLTRAAKQPVRADVNDRFVLINTHVASEAKPAEMLDGTQRIPHNKWNLDDLRRERLAASFMNFIRDLDAFDGEAFGVRMEEARRIDPQQRLALRAAMIAVDASKSGLAVFLGIASRDYCDLVNRNGIFSASTYDAVGSFGSVASGRISFAYDFKGPSTSIDTACSSALVSAHQCRTEMLMGTVCAALVGGVNVILHPRVTEQFNRAGMLSPSGRCQTLDASADGYVRAEACRFIRMELVNKCAGVNLRSSAINQDGRSSALTAPNGPSQRDVIAMCQHDPRGACFFLHLHGTGTPLGDPIEISALSALAGETSSIDLDASKSWFGHGEPASGVVAMTHLLSELATRCAIGMRNLAHFNPYVVTSARWMHVARVPSSRECTRCGTSSFAFQGSNAHVGVDFNSQEDAAVKLDCWHTLNARRAWCEPRTFQSVPRVHLTIGRDMRFVGDVRVVAGVEDHRVSGKILFPAAGMLHAALCSGLACADCATLCASATIPSSLEIVKESTSYELVVRRLDGSCALVARSRTRFKAYLRAAVPCQRNANNMDETLVITHERARAVHATPVDPETVYEALRRRGLDYGPYFRVLRNIRRGLRSRIAVIADVKCVVGQIAAMDGIMQLAAPMDVETPLAIPIGAEACFGGISDVARACAWAHASSLTSSSHAMVSENISNWSCIQRLRAKTLNSRSTTSTLSATRYFTKRCAESHPPEKYFGVSTADYSRVAVSCAQCFSRCRAQDTDVQVAGVHIDHTLGAVKSAASEFGSAIDASESRVHESYAHVERLEVERPLRKRAQRLSECIRTKSTHSKETHVIGAFGSLGLVTTKTTLIIRSSTVLMSGRLGRGNFNMASESMILPRLIRATSRDAATRTPQRTIEDSRNIFVAGALADGLISRLTARSFRIVFAPKTESALKFSANAHKSTAVYFSSVASLLGSAGQFNYAAANGAMDFIARSRRRLGVDEVSIQFGPWAEGGMAVRHSDTLRRLREMGIAALSANEGASVLRASLQRAVTCVAALSLRTLAANAVHLKNQLLFEHRSASAPPRMTQPSKKYIVKEDRAIRDIDVERKLSSAVAAALGRVVDRDAPLMQAGIDSLLAMDLTSAASSMFDVDLPSTVLFDHPTIASASREITRLRFDVHDQPCAKVVTSQRMPGSNVRQRAFAAPRIVSQAGEMSRRALDRDTVQRIDPEREAAIFLGAPSAFCGFTLSYERLVAFDACVIGPTSSSELLHLDPRQRLLIDATAKCVAALKYSVDTHGQCGVYVGCAGKDYSRLLEGLGLERGAFHGVGNETSVVSGRISFVFAINGPALSIDTACSSSLCAVSISLAGFESNVISRAYVAGASLVLTDDMHRVLGGAGMLSPAGRCRSFDEAADGYGRSEGVELLVFAASTKDASAVAVLAGAAVNQDGRSSSLTAPSGSSQEEVIKLATNLCASLNRDRDGKVLHTHGTGTALGDPIEINAAIRALVHSRDPLVLQASKSHCGHAEPAAGAVAIVFAIEHSLRSSIACGICHLRRLNKHVRLANAVAPRIPVPVVLDVNAHVSAFAFQGTNSAIVVAPSDDEMAVMENDMYAITHARRYWPTRAPEVRSVTCSRGARMMFDVSVGCMSFPFVLSRAVERALDDDVVVVSDYVAGCDDGTEYAQITVDEDIIRSSFGCVARAQGLGKASPVAVSFVISYETQMSYALTSKSGAAFGLPIACKCLAVRRSSMRSDGFFSSETCRGVTERHRSDGSMTFLAIGVERDGYRRRRNVQCIKGRITYSVINSSLPSVRPVSVRPVSVRSVSTAMMLAQTSFTSTRHDHLIGCELEVIFRSGGIGNRQSVQSQLRYLKIDDVSSERSAPVQALVLGGTGALGRIICRRLLGDVIACSRVGRSWDTRPNSYSMEVLRCDHSLREDAFVSQVSPRLALHSGGVLADATLQNQRTHGIARVFAPKIVASTNAHKSESPCRSVLFSSIAALVAPFAQANYASANTALDTFAERSQERGDLVTSVRWGAFQAIGMASCNVDMARDLATYGIAMLSLDAGLDVLRKIMLGAATPAMFVVSPLNVMKRKKHDVGPLTEGTNVSMTPEVCAKVIERIVAELVGSPLPRTAPMMAAGLDSVSSVELLSAVERKFDVVVPSTLAFDYPSIDAMAAFVSCTLNKNAENNACDSAINSLKFAHREKQSHLYAHSRSGRVFTGDDNDSALISDRSIGTTCIPPWRWNVDESLGLELPVRFAACLSDIDTFDRAVFSVSAPEAMAMDPQQRGVLERVCACRPGDLSDSAVGVYVGIQHFEYALLDVSGELGSHAATGRALSVCAGRVSYIFGFTESSLAVDTACSASLVTVHLALMDEARASAHACVGINFILTRKTCDAARAAGMLASDGRCKAIDATADGYGRGEAVACVVLARDSRGCVAFVVLGGACAQDGRSSALTAPNGPAQRRVIADAWQLLQCAKDVVRYVSMHGTGTALGDPIECSSLKDIYHERSQGDTINLLASKSAVSHAEAAAGSVGMFHLVACFASNATPSIVGLRTINPHVTLSDILRAPRQMAAAVMPCDGETIAGCSAFAFMGTNAHIVLRKATDALPVRQFAFERESLWPTFVPTGCFTLGRVTCLPSPMRDIMEVCVTNFREYVTCITFARLACDCARVCNGVGRRGFRRNTAQQIVVYSSVTDFPSADFTLRMRLSGEMRMDAIGAKCQLGFNAMNAPGGRGCLIRWSKYVEKRSHVVMLRCANTSFNAFSVVSREALCGAAVYHSNSIEDANMVFTAASKESFSRHDVHGAATETMHGCNVARPSPSSPVYYSSRGPSTPSQPKLPPSVGQKAKTDVGPIVYGVLRELFGQDVDPASDLASRGIDSIGAIELATTLKRKLMIEGSADMSVLATLPTPGAIVSFITDTFFSPKDFRATQLAVGATERAKQIKTLKTNDRSPALFLGAPAFGDGPLAYYKLTNALNLGAHPCRTLERDVTEQPWPQVSLDHADEIMRLQSEGAIVLGGHSLGGVLAIETALAIERCGREVASIFLFDAPHPVQFKSDWNDIPAAIDEEESTGLTYMEVALTSFHFDTVAAGWDGMTREEKYALFESVAFQALGREFNAKTLDEDISKGPYAAQWNSGMEQMEDGSIDSGSWWMLRGGEAAVEPTKTFSRVAAKVVHYKAGLESSALFETELEFKDTKDEVDGVSRSVGGYVWALACDHVEVVRCRGSHMNLMTSEAEGGDLNDTIGPHVRRALNTIWEDIAVDRIDASATPWRSRVWHQGLGLWMSASPELDDVSLDDVSMNERSLSSNNAILRAVDSIDSFDCAVFGLNRLAWECNDTTAQVWIVADLLQDVDSWSHACFASTLPCVAVHVPIRALDAIATMNEIRASIAARCVRSVRRANGVDAVGARFHRPLIVASSSSGGELEALAFEIARQLKRRGETTVAVVFGASSRSNTTPTLQALEFLNDDPTVAVNRHATAVTDSVLRLTAQCALRRPLTLRADAWRAEICREIALTESSFALARDAFHPSVVVARDYDEYLGNA